MSDFDLAIIGAGPAGMSAAIEARAFDLRVVVFDERPAPGGQIYATIERNSPADGEADRKLLAALGRDYERGASLVARFRACGALYLPGSSVWHASSAGDIAYNRSDETGERSGSARLRAARIIIATGAQERPTPVPGWTLPGVMSLGGAQLMLKGASMIPSAPVVIVGSGPLALLYAAQVHALGGVVSAFVQPGDTALFKAAIEHGIDALHGVNYLWKGVCLLAKRALCSTKVYREVSDVCIDGDERAQNISFDCGANRVRLPARTVLLHDGIVPQLQLTRLLEVEHRWHERGRYQMPVTNLHGRSSQAGIFVAGDGRCIDGARAAIHSGALAALASVIDLQPHRQQHARFRLQHHEAQLQRETRVRPFLDTLYQSARWPFENIHNDTIVCRCENITAGAIQASCAAAIASADRMKALHRCGMGPCQGRMCEYSVALIAANTLHCHPSEFGLHRIREPIKPVSLGALASLAIPTVQGDEQ